MKLNILWNSGLSFNESESIIQLSTLIFTVSGTMRFLLHLNLSFKTTLSNGLNPFDIRDCNSKYSKRPSFFLMIAACLPTANNTHSQILPFPTIL